MLFTPSLVPPQFESFALVSKHSDWGHKDAKGKIMCDHFKKRATRKTRVGIFMGSLLIGNLVKVNPMTTKLPLILQTNSVHCLLLIKTN